MQAKTQQALEAAHEGRDQTEELQTSGNMALAQVEATLQSVTEAASLEQAERNQFWWEFSGWIGISMVGSALLAEPKKEKIYASN
jgi:hypothetical protein